MINDELIAEDLLRAFDERFVNRHDTFALQHDTGRYTRVQLPLDLERLQAHLTGRQTVALYAVDRSGRARWLCFDSDAADGLVQLRCLQIALERGGITSVLEQSRRGGHLWVLCAVPLPARLLRALGRGIIAVLQARKELSGSIELYPDVDGVVGEGVGPAVRLPFGVHRLTGQRYGFMDALDAARHSNTLVGQLTWLMAQPRVTAEQVQTGLARIQVQVDEVLDQVVERVAHAFAREGHIVQQDRRRGLWPEATGFGHAAAQQGAPCRETAAEQSAAGAAGGDPVEVIGWVDAHLHLPDLITATHAEVGLRRSGQGWIGWCPFHDDEAPQADGSPGTPSLYVVQNRRYGWSWRCLSSNCGTAAGPMHHTFDWLTWCHAGSVARAADWVRERYRYQIAPHEPIQMEETESTEESGRCVASEATLRTRATRGATPDLWRGENGGRAQ